MRILVLTSMYPPHSYGGYELSCMDVVERWRHAGMDVQVLTSTIRVPGRPLSAATEDVSRDLHIYWEDHHIVAPSIGRRAAWERANERTLERALTNYAPDVVSVWAMGAMSMGLLNVLAREAVPTVLVICDEWPIYGPEIDGWAKLFLDRPLRSRMAALLTGASTTPPPLDTIGPSCFVSDFLRRTVRERSRWSFPDSTVVYSGIATHEFEFSHPRDRWNWRLSYIGRIDPRKGITTAIEALALLPSEATLCVVGGGDRRHLSELRDRAAELGLADRVEFTEAPRAELKRWYAASDVVVFPPTWDEPFGLVPLEAMACGTPVVATAAGGSAEFLVHRENCLVFPASDAAALARAVTELADDGELRNHIVLAGRTTAAQLDVDRLAEVLGDWHRHAAGMPEAGRPADRVLRVTSGRIARPLSATRSSRPNDRS